MGANVANYGAGGGICGDVWNMFQSSHPSHPLLWIIYVGRDPPPPLGTGGIPKSVRLMADGKSDLT